MLTGDNDVDAQDKYLILVKILSDEWVSSQRRKLKLLL
jgi:hypothetical protein